MAGAFITAKLDDAKVQNLFAQIVTRSGSARPAWNIIGQEVVKSVRENFIAGGRPAKWAPLAASTLFKVAGGRKGWKKRGGLTKGAIARLGGKKILVGKGMAGGLMGSIHYDASIKGCVIGTDKPYAAAHQFGVNKSVTVRRHSIKTIFGTKSSAVSSYTMHMRIPARPYLMIQDNDSAHMLTAMGDYLLAK